MSRPAPGPRSTSCCANERSGCRAGGVSCSADPPAERHPRDEGALAIVAEALEDLLRVSQEALRVATAGSGGGVIKISEAVPRKLRNVVVLDASQSIRKLAKMDDSIELVKNFEARMVKSFEAVKVVQIVAGGPTRRRDPVMAPRLATS